MRKAFNIIISLGCKLWCCVTVRLIYPCDLCIYLFIFFYEQRRLDIMQFNFFFLVLFLFHLFLHSFLFEHCLLFVNLVERLDFFVQLYLILRFLINNKSFWSYQLLTVPHWTQRQRKKKKESTCMCVCLYADLVVHTPPQSKDKEMFYLIL